MNIGDNIKKFRELKSITREQMAADLDMSVSGYSKIERNEVDLTMSKVQKISQLLNIDLSQILSFDANQIFNVSNNTIAVQSLGAKAENMHFHTDEYKEKYIKILEEENERLKRLIKE